MRLGLACGDDLVLPRLRVLQFLLSFAKAFLSPKCSRKSMILLVSIQTTTTTARISTCIGADLWFHLNLLRGFSSVPRMDRFFPTLTVSTPSSTALWSSAPAALTLP